MLGGCRKNVFSLRNLRVLGVSAVNLGAKTHRGRAEFLFPTDSLESNRGAGETRRMDPQLASTLVLGLHRFKSLGLIKKGICGLQSSCRAIIIRPPLATLKAHSALPQLKILWRFLSGPTRDWAASH